MPTTSIVIPHRQDQAQLEKTLVSVLENRPADCEILVVHDGSYADPYDLSDEVTFVEEKRGATIGELINAGLKAACAPIINLVLAGTRVTCDWTQEAVERMLAEPELAVVAVPCRFRSGRTTAGIDRLCLKNPQRIRQEAHWAPSSKPERVIGPALNCAFFRRRVMLALDGLYESPSLAAMALDFALCCQALGLSASCAEHTQVQIDSPEIDDLPKKAIAQELARVASAHQLISSGVGTAIQQLLSPRTVLSLMPTLGWVQGLLSPAGVEVEAKLARAAVAIASYKAEEAARPPHLRIFAEGFSSQRRAA